MPTMSSSFLKPSVTPVTALATRLRARPWNLPSAGSSRSSVATIVPLSCANAMPGGTHWLNLPFGPCTSIAPGAIFTLTPFGSAIGFLPILTSLDLVALPAGSVADTSRPASWLTRRLPHVAEHFATDAGFPRRAAGHHAPRGREDVRAEAAEHRRHVVDAEYTRRPGRLMRSMPEITFSPCGPYSGTRG